ncbi:MAG: type II and III secretion system protein [Bdellovibrionales bacterium]|nr:type II and III secretion system protein [Bdellovibrionales bacterium]
MILTLLLSFAFALEDQQVMYPGQSRELSISRGGTIEIETRGIIKANDRGSKLKVVAVKKGETRIKTSFQNYNISVIDKDSYDTFLKLREWQKGKVGPLVEVVDQKIEIGGKILTFLDWLELKDLQLHKGPYFIKAKVDFEVTDKINRYLRDLTQKSNLPYSSLTVSPIWQVTLAETHKNHISEYRKLLAPLGIYVGQSPYALNSAPMIEVNILATEIRRNHIQKLGLDWPAEVKANLVPSLAFDSQSLFVNIKAFEQRGLGRVLASPTLIAKSGESATFHSGGEMPIKVSSRFAAQVEWKKYGIVLKIKPVADYSGKMTIELECEVSMIDESVKIDGIPGLLINRITSRFHLNESKTIALSGLIKEEWGRSHQGFPGITQIPILNKIFGSEEFKNNQSELFFFVTPKIIY